MLTTYLPRPDGTLKFHSSHATLRAGEKLRIGGIRAGTFVKHFFDPLHRKSDTREPIQIGKDRSTNIRSVALVDNTETHFLLHSAKIQQETPHPSRTLPPAICYYEKLPLSTNTAKIDICLKPTYWWPVSFEISFFAMRVTLILLNTGARLSLVDKTFIPQTWKHLIQWESFPRLWTATKQLLHVEGKVLLHVHFGSFWTRVWYGAVPNLSVDLLRGTTFIGRLIHGIFPPKRKFVLRHSHPVVILSTNHHHNSTPLQEVALISKKNLGKHIE